MILRHLESFKKDYDALSPKIQKRVDKQLGFLIQNSQHPSLRAKKMKGFKDIWEARITKNYRFTFQIKEDTYIFRRIGTHDILRGP